MITEQVTTLNPHVNKFINKCKIKGFKNNESLAAMKWHWCIDLGGTWFATFKDDEIISMSGIHPFKDGYRSLFRGAQLEPRPVQGLNKYQFQSWGMYAELPLQIEFAKKAPIYITTNIYNDASGKMNRIHNAFKILNKNKIVEYCRDEEVFYTLQSIWKLNVDRYLEVRRKHADVD